MGLIHDTGYEPAYNHEGYTAAVLDDGTETATYTREIGERTVGWRPACACGWRLPRFWARADYPDEHGRPPDELDGVGGATELLWTNHLEQTLPELPIHDLTRRTVIDREHLANAVANARGVGVPWDTIGAAAGMSRQSAHERWAKVLEEGTSDDPVGPVFLNPPTDTGSEDEPVIVALSRTEVDALAALVAEHTASERGELADTYRSIGDHLACAQRTPVQADAAGVNRARPEHPVNQLTRLKRTVLRMLAQHHGLVTLVDEAIYTAAAIAASRTGRAGVEEVASNAEYAATRARVTTYGQN